MEETKLNKQNKENTVKLFEQVYRLNIFNDDNLERFLKIVSEDLTDREAGIITLRYGLDGSGLKTIADAAKEFGISSESLRQSECTAIRKLRHPVRYKYVLGIAEEKIKKTYDLFSDLKETELSPRTINCLNKLGVNTVVDLLNIKIVTIVESKTIGNKSFKEIVEFIKANKNIK